MALLKKKKKKHDVETTKDMSTPETPTLGSKVGTSQNSLIPYSTASIREIKSIFPLQW